MKKNQLFTLIIMCAHSIVGYGQYGGSYDDPVARHFAIQHANMNDGMYDYIITGLYNEVYGPARPVNQDKIIEAILNARPQQNEVQEEEYKNQQQRQARPQRVGGIQFSYETDPRYQPQKKSAEQIQREKQKQAEAEARRRQWEEERRRAAEDEARRKAEWLKREEAKLRREYERKEQEYQRIHAEEAKKAHAIYQQNVEKVSYTTGEGRENMYRYHVPGTERRSSQYVAASVSNNASSIIPQREYKTTNTIALSGNEKVMAQTRNWQSSVDSARNEAINNPETHCKEVIEVESIGNGCGPANDKTKQILAKIGLFIDASFNVLIDPTKINVIKEMERLDRVCSDIHDPGYVKAKTVREKTKVDFLLMVNGGHLMGLATLLKGDESWRNARKDYQISQELSKEFKGSFDPETQLLRKVRKCGEQKNDTK